MEVTARKWRPKDFEEFIGQEHVVHSLKNALKNKNFGHAYLFSGPRGIGKTSCARVFAKALNCLANGPTDSPCGKCENCIEIKDGNSMDVIEIDGASNRGIDQIRELRENIQYMPSKSRYKIYIIDEVHMLTDQAFNALLKTLEEPPRHIVFIFATTEVHKVKVTIRSRCQHFRFKRLSLKEINGQLEKILGAYKIAFEKDAVKYIAKASDGSMRDGESILDQAIVYCDGKLSLSKVKEILGTIADEQFIQLIEIIIHEKTDALYHYINNLYQEGEDIGFFVEGMIQQFRYILLAKNNITNFQELEETHYEKIKTFAGFFTNYQIYRIIELFINLHKELKTSDKERFILENYFFQVLDYKNFIPIPVLLNKVTELESKLSGELGLTLKEPIMKKQEGELTPKEEKGVIHRETENEATEKKEDLFEEEKQEEKINLTPDQVWKEFKGKVSENSAKLSAIFNNIINFEYQDDSLKLEFISPFEEAVVKKDLQLMNKIKNYFAKFNMQIKSIITYVKKPDLGIIDKPVDYIKENFKGEEI